MSFNNYNEHDKLQSWILENLPSDKFIYKKAWENHVVFIRDTVIPKLLYKEASKNHKDWKSINEEMCKHYDIIGEHTSKSVKLPVYKINCHGVEIIFRYNFYDYEVTVISPKDIKLDKELFNDTKHFYHQGVPDEYIVDTLYSQDKKKFTVNVSNDYEFYALIMTIYCQIKNMK